MRSNGRTLIFAGLLAAMAIGVIFFRKQGILPAPHLTIKPAQVVADGYDRVVMHIETTARGTPKLSLPGSPYRAFIEEIARADRGWQAVIRAGILPGRIRVRVELPGVRPSEIEFESVLYARDSAGDGTPDFLRLDDSHDRQAFRRWFRWLAEAQYFQSPVSRPSEINDCAALIRYAYREALHVHDDAWSASAQLPLLPAFDSVTKVQYPFTPLGAGLFRIRPGPFQPSDLGSGAFAQFADAETLWRRNTHFVSRSVEAALPGDLLFFRQETGNERFHSMIYLGDSSIRKDGKRYILYHTGPTGSDPGEIRRPAVEELVRFPKAEWRPVTGNPSFLGVFRWNILRKDVHQDDPGRG
ncbi:MAG: DUF1175 domain-containing protein [Bryobacteraceae bacterium]